jgi:hypothetical protein
MLRDLLDSIDQKDDFDPALHAQFMRAMTETPAGAMSLTERFRAANYLQLAVMYIAGEKGWRLEKEFPDGSGGHVAGEVVDEARLPAEMSILHRLRETLGYSPAVANWIASKRDEVAARIMQDESFGRRWMGWPKMDAEQKRQLLQDVVAANMDAYRGEGFDIAVPPVMFDDEIKGAAALTAPEIHTENGKAVPGVKCIRAGAGLRDAPDPFLAVILCYHESVHAVLTQLAAARARGALPDDHPLRDDADVALAERMFGGATPFIRSIYEGDPEERLVFDAQARFSDSLLAAATPAPG